MRNTKNDTIIRKAFVDNKGRYGRLSLSAYISMKYNIYINRRSLGRDLKRLNLICKIRKQRRKSEIKNTKFVLTDIVKRDYNDKLNRNIFATGVSYIKALKDVKDNHVFLSVIIEHKTKKSKILNYLLTMIFI
ncbi:transposase [Mycoplasma tauri]|uniref:transposase n=1 Tax=Mycoplasma tauri TaxID=547987 RepID=UPI00358E295D